VSLETCYLDQQRIFSAATVAKNATTASRFNYSVCLPKHRDGNGIESVTKTDCTLAVIHHNTSDKPIAHRFLELCQSTKARVCQMIALCRRLPSAITDYLLDTDDPETLEFFTERRLRHLTLMATDDDMITRFKEMIEAINID
jgi:hypothetical protein